jgi:hypothetical protein
MMGQGLTVAGQNEHMASVMMVASAGAGARRILAMPGRRLSRALSPP